MDAFYLCWLLLPLTSIAVSAILYFIIYKKRNRLKREVDQYLNKIDALEIMIKEIRNDLDDINNVLKVERLEIYKIESEIKKSID